MKSCWETRHSSTTTTYSYSRKRSLVDVGVPARLKDSSRRFKTSAGGPAVANAAKIGDRAAQQQPKYIERGSAMEKRRTYTLTLIQFLVCRSLLTIVYIYRNWIWRKLSSIKRDLFKIYRRQLNSQLKSFSKQTFFYINNII